MAQVGVVNRVALVFGLAAAEIGVRDQRHFSTKAVPGFGETHDASAINLPRIVVSSWVQAGVLVSVNRRCSREKVVQRVTKGGLLSGCCKVEARVIVERRGPGSFHSFACRRTYYGQPISDENKALLDAKVKAAETRIKKVINYTNQNESFTGKLLLAMSTATLMVIFGLPLFSSNLKHMVFGHGICDASATGFYLNSGTEEKPDLKPVVSWADITVTDWTTPGKLIDCGFIPRSYQGFWPNVVQFCFFSVFQNTGTTVQLTLQGLSGTFLATINVFLLYELYPHGGAMTECAGDRLASGACEKGDMMYLDPNFIPAVAWADGIGFALLWLISTAPKNMVMFCLSYHWLFMCTFMDPKANLAVESVTGSLPMGFLDLYWDSQTTIINLTSILGGILAILATLIPKPLLNTRKLTENCTIAAEGLEEAWTEALDYFFATSATSKKFQVASRMEAIKSAFDRVEESLGGAWFEHFDIGTKGIARELFRLFKGVGRKVQNVVKISKAALLREEFGGNHDKFADGIQKETRELNTVVADLFQFCCQCCKDGHIDTEEKDKINELLNEVRGKQRSLAAAYAATMKEQHYVSEDLANENAFIYGFSAYARAVADFAEELPHTAAEKHANQCSFFCKSLASTFTDMFSLDLLMDKEHLKFAIVNFLPVFVTFLIAVFTPGDGLFVPYSALMPGSLALIITSTYGSTFKGNIERLVGIVLGNIIPVLVLAIVFSFPCESWMRTVTQMVLVWLYFFLFSYVYYASATWSFVGCALCGFGAYPLMQACTGGSFSYGMHDHYQTIAQVTVAVLIRMLIETALLDKAPRDLAVKQLEDLLDTIHDAYKLFFAGKYDQMAEKHTKATDMLSHAKALHAESSPALEVVPGPRLPFKHALYGQVLDQLDMGISQLGVLVVSAKDWAPEKVAEEKSSAREAAESHQQTQFTELDEGEMMDQGMTGTGGARASVKKVVHESTSNAPKIHQIMEAQTSFQLLEDDMLDTFERVFNVVKAIVKHDQEQRVESADEDIEKLATLGGLRTLDDVNTFYNHINKFMEEKERPAVNDVVESMQARLTVLVSALNTATGALGEVGVLCLKDAIY
ncbi:unnamed protein product [Symbiodinium natans]|uniref:Uncharacterized protein n=1 Tax=Symbiodinium natans TaxID=878477 RepID=A0A812Q7Y9_9DINO|nr:unnamed protein product [Symbiodinium natans]